MLPVISYDEGYDPTAIMLDRLAAPWADVRLRGYLRGRAALTLSLKQRGFSLKVFTPHSALGFGSPLAFGLEF